jgi:hypothetical protein
MTSAERRLAEDLTAFLVEAKRGTRAVDAPFKTGSAGWRGTESHSYERTPFVYKDSYVGSRGFIGEEMVWRDGIAVWGMNYYGRSSLGELPAAGMRCLAAALREVPSDAPYRGPAIHRLDGFEYRCAVEGDVASFSGREEILNSVDGELVFVLRFHGGFIA